jgi:hypothetical protein
VLRGGVKALARLTGDGEPAEHAQPEEDAQPADEPVELAGYGPIPDWLARELLTHRHTRVMVLDRRLRLDCRPVPGYQVPAWMAGAVLAVHAHCAFPGCAIPAHRCDLDHVLAHPRGPTCVCNLVPLCRWHHRLKTHGGWRLRLLAGRIAQWTSPIGRRYLVHPDGETEADVGEAAGVGGPRSCAAEPRRPRGQNGGRRFATVPE